MSLKDFAQSSNRHTGFSTRCQEWWCTCNGYDSVTMIVPWLRNRHWLQS